METLVDPERYRGSCYRGANWIELGSTRGAKREDRLARGEAVRPKRVLVYPLVAEAAVAGTTRRITAGRRTATGTNRRTGTTTWAFVWPAAPKVE